MNLPKLLFKGPVTTASGYGVHARQLLKALIDSNEYDIYVAPIRWGQTSYIYDDSLLNKIKELSLKFDSRGENFEFDISVQVTIPNEFEKLAKYNIGVTAGIEVNYVSPQWILKCNENVDLVVVPSKHSYDVFKNTVFRDNNGNVHKLEKPLAICHEGVDVSLFNTEKLNENESTFNFDTKFNFISVGLGIDKNLGEDRKNLGLLIKWFCERFKDSKDVGLVLKTGLVNNSLMDFYKISSRIKEIKKLSGCDEYPKIHLVHGRLSSKELSHLYKNETVKAYVTTTHGEGFGLPILEAAACGLPVIATNWSGHLDFLSIDGKKKFVNLDFSLTDIPDSCVWEGVMEKGTKWATVNEEDFKNKCLKLFLSYDAPKKWADELANYIYENFSYEKTNKTFSDLITNFYSQIKLFKPTNTEDLFSRFDSLYPEIRFNSSGSKNKTLLYTMPMSAGDVYISTAVVNSLKKKFNDHKIIFATHENFKSILKNNKDIDYVINFEEWMMNVPLLESMFDEVYTPNLAVQMIYSNWVHKGKGRLLANEMANQCNVDLGDYFIHCEKPNFELPENYIVINPGSGKDNWEARNYVYWQEVINNLNKTFDRTKIYKIVQVGLNDDPQYMNCIDLRGKTNDFNELAYIIQNAKLVLGIDSVTMHMAAGLGVDHVALFGSSYPTSTGPVVKSVDLARPERKICKSLLLETPSRYTCDKACYRYQCDIDRDYPCINEIDGKVVWSRVLHTMGIPVGKASGMVDQDTYEEYSPKIAGYTHVYNAETHEYPYIESIKSMLGFCDKVIVIDGGSEDATVQRIKDIGSDKIEVIEKKWDWSEPGMDGMQKAFGRAMCPSEYEFLWQQDVDEVIHEDDYAKIKALVKRFPKNMNLLHLPMIELWGDKETVRTDRHAWKWRLSRNDFRITHGIVKYARVFDEKTGKTYSKKGMSDGCEYIDIMTGEYIHHTGFWNNELEKLRVTNPDMYGEEMNKIFNEFPCVFHYSWANIPRKIRNFKKFWNKCWSNLYNDEQPEDRFPDVDLNDNESVLKKSNFLKEVGSEHGMEKCKTFKLQRSNPKLMNDWTVE